MKDLIFRQIGKDGLYKIWHTPEKNIFIFIESGEGSIVVREKSYPIASGVLCFIGQNKYHYTFPKNSDEYVRSKLFLDAVSLEKIIQSFGVHSDFAAMFHSESVTTAILSGEEFERASLLFKRLAEQSDADPYRQAEVNCTASQLMLILVKNLATQTQSKPDPIQRVIEYIHSHIQDDLSIDQIAVACYMSKYYLCRLFKKKMDLTIMEYILQTRLTMAKELLTQGERSVTQISHDCGFCSPSYFSRIFKEKVGQSPSKYQKINS